jgi:hypothetical protein
MPASWQQVARLELVAVDDGFMVYDEDRDRVHYLNSTGALVLVLCNGANTLAEIAAALQAQFALEQAPEQDVAGVLDRLVDEGLVLAPDEVAARDH